MINIISAMTDGYTCLSPCLKWGAVGKCMVLPLVSLFEFVWSNFTSSYVDSGLTTFLLAIATRKGKILKMLHGMPVSWKGNGASGCNVILIHITRTSHDAMNIDHIMFNSYNMKTTGLKCKQARVRGRIESIGNIIYQDPANDRRMVMVGSNIVSNNLPLPIFIIRYRFHR
jgi:hypothetical protein